MRIRWISFVVVMGAAASGCKDTECGEGTVDRNGECVAADVVVGPAECGEFTVLVGDKCEPMFPPTECDPATTAEQTDPETGVTTCIGTGGGGCSAPLACPAPTSGKQTLCGRLYNFEDNQRLEATDAMGTRCNPAAPTADGPCALGIRAYDAIQFAGNPTGATPRPTADMYIDDCGRWRLTDIDNTTSGFVGLGIDDIAAAGPSGSTVTVGVATAQAANGSINNMEGYIVKPTTIGKWTTSGGSGAPTLATGFYAPVFRANRTGFAAQSGVVAVKQAGLVTANDFYFAAAEVTRETVDVARNFTGANGTALITGASLADVGYSGVPAAAGMGLPPECKYPGLPGVTLTGIVFISIFRPENATGMTCNR